MNPSEPEPDPFPDEAINSIHVYQRTSNELQEIQRYDVPSLRWSHYGVTSGRKNMLCRLVSSYLPLMSWEGPAGRYILIDDIIRSDYILQLSSCSKIVQSVWSIFACPHLHRCELTRARPEETVYHSYSHPHSSQGVEDTR